MGGTVVDQFVEIGILEIYFVLSQLIYIGTKNISQKWCAYLRNFIGGSLLQALWSPL